MRQKLVLFDTGGTVYELDGQDNWQKRVTTHLPMPARTYAGFGYHAATGETLYFGGHVVGNILGDTLIWNNTDWMLSPAVGPPNQEGAALVGQASISRR